MHISKSNLTSKNLNLLVIFEAILETRNLTEAATRLRMAQPNLSRALKLLRHEFKDPLFVRGAKGLTPTKRALELGAPLKEALSSVQHLYENTDFDISKIERKITIGATDYIEFLLAPSLSTIVAKEAPGVTLNFRPSGGDIRKKEMEEGEYDLTVLVVRERIPPNYFKQDLFLDPYVGAVRKGHPILKGEPTIEKFLSFGHVLLNPQGTLWSITDEKLAKLKKKRQLLLGTPNALSAIAAVAKTDAILTATKGFVDATKEFFPIETFPAPFKLDPIQISQVWHERSQEDPLNVWVRGKIRSLLRISEK